MITLKVENNEFGGGYRKVANFPNWSRILTMDVHLKLELAVFV
jgi:hypothetical protein